MFGTHELCDISGCKYLQVPETYKPQNLPYKPYLQDPKLKEDLKCLLQEFATHSDTLSELGSTQANESLNNTVASKAPKAVFFSGSESNDFREAAAVAQTILGHQYVPKVILVRHKIERSKSALCSAFYVVFIHVASRRKIVK